MHRRRRVFRLSLQLLHLRAKVGIVFCDLPSNPAVYCVEIELVPAGVWGDLGKVGSVPAAGLSYLFRRLFLPVQAARPCRVESHRALGDPRPQLARLPAAEIR